MKWSVIPRSILLQNIAIVLVTDDNKHNPYTCQGFWRSYVLMFQQKTEDGPIYIALSFMLQLHSGSKNGIKIF